MEDVPEARLEMRVRNNRLLSAIYKNHRSVQAFCRAYGLSPQSVGKLCNLKCRPYNAKRGRWTLTARRVAQALVETPEYLFPLALYDVEESARYLEISLPDLTQITSGKQGQIAAGSPEAILGDAAFEQVAQRDLERAVREHLDILKPIQRRVLCLRFGLDGEGEHTLVECAEILDLPYERIRQIEGTAIGRFRRYYTKALRPFIDVGKPA